MSGWELILKWVLTPVEVACWIILAHTLWDVRQTTRRWKAEDLARKLYDDN